MKLWKNKFMDFIMSKDEFLNFNNLIGKVDDLEKEIRKKE